MQKLKSKVFEKFQIENKVQYMKALPRSRVFQSVMAALMLVGLLSWLHIRPLGLIFLAIFIFWWLKSYCNLRIRAPPQLESHLRTLQHRVIEFRKSRPTMFCALASGFCATLAVMGKFMILGTLTLFLSIVVAAILSDWNYQREMRNYEREMESYAEFLPDTNGVDMTVLERASELSLQTLPSDDDENDEDRSDEVPSELLIADSMPEIDENSTDDDQDELLPIPESETHLKTSSPSCNELVKFSKSNDIEFKTRHFKRDSSLSTSSSEESLSKGLHFPDHTAVDGPRHYASSTTLSQEDSNQLEAMAVSSQAQALIAHSSKLLPTLMTGLVQGVFGRGALPAQSGPVHDPTNRRIVTALDSSDESDFEILEQEDFQ